MGPSTCGTPFFCAGTPSLKLTILSQISEELLLFILYYIVGGQAITAMG